MHFHRRAGDGHFEGRNDNGAGVIYMYQGRLEEAADCYSRSLAIHAAEGDLWMKGVALGNLAILALECGRLEEARSQINRALVSTEQAGARRAHAICVATSGRIWLDAGDLMAARRDLGRAVQEHRAVVDERFEGLAQLYLGLALEESGQRRAAREAFAAARELSGTIGDRRCEARALVYRARLNIEREEEARKMLAGARKMLAATGDKTAHTLLKLVAAQLDLSKSPSGWRSACALVDSAEVGYPRSAELRSSRRLLIAAIDRAIFSERRCDVIRIDALANAMRLPHCADEVPLRDASPNKRVLLHLARHRRALPGSPVDVDALFAAGWPDQKASAESRKSRVKVALSKLRKLGLRPWLERRDGGYLLSPSVWVALRD
jgi:hypothetical protein